MRRNDIQKMVPAELACREAVLAIEALPADQRLTEAVVLIGEAQRLVADFVDGVPFKQQYFPVYEDRKITI